jgi:hypothetical protein
MRNDMNSNRGRRGGISRGRREFLQHGLVGMGVLATGPLLSRCREATTSASTVAVTGGDPTVPSAVERMGRNFSRLGPLAEPDVNGVRLPQGFSSRVIARSSHKVVDHSEYLWHGAPDGGAVFPAEAGGWVYVCNSEVGGYRGGAGALRFDARGEVIDAYSVLEGTTANCAGGATPWGTWLSCEEYDQGRVWECDPFGKRKAVAWPALGVFKHEAAAVDPGRHHVYLTEDRGDGLFYRFTPDRVTAQGRPDLSRGKLEAAHVLGGREGRVIWRRIPDPSGTRQPTRLQSAKATVFKGGEGIWFHDDVVYFTTKLDERVWAYDIPGSAISVVYDASRSANPELTAVDNVTVSAGGDVIVAEDGGNNQIVALTPDRGAVAILQVVGHDGSELCGPAFDPSGTRLYFSSQRGETGLSEDGVTYEVSGPFLR